MPDIAPVMSHLKLHRFSRLVPYEEATRKAEEARTRDLQCNAARERFNVYTTAPRLYETLPGGERRYLTEDELTAAREQAQADIEKWCD